MYKDRRTQSTKILSVYSAISSNVNIIKTSIERVSPKERNEGPTLLK